MAGLPPRASPERTFEEILHRLHSRWRLVIMLPLVYMMVGLLIHRFYFEAERGGEGFFPMQEEILLMGLFVGGAFAVGMWRLLSLTERRNLLELSELRENPETFLARAREHQLIRFALCDLSAAPGVILFLLEGDLFPLIAFCVISLVLYLRVIPSSRKLGEAMFRPDLLNEEIKRG